MKVAIKNKRLLRPTCCQAVVFFLLVLPVLFVPQAIAGDFDTPQKGTAERAAIMDSLRVPVEAVLRQPVIFVVKTLRVGDGWAFVVGVPRASDGGPVDYGGTRYGDAIDAGAFEDEIVGLLRNDGNRWVVVDFTIGATDVVYETWDVDYGAPRELFFGDG